MNSRAAIASRKIYAEDGAGPEELYQKQLDEAEQLYQVANRKWGTREAIESLQTMIKKYPNLDRTAAQCSILPDVPRR